MRRILLACSFAVALAVSACGGGAVDYSAVPELPEATPESITALLAASDDPVVLNVWASWCLPCRSEAPLLARAAGDFAGRVTFIGLNYRNTQDRARAFIAEFYAGAPIIHLIDDGNRIPAALGGTIGVPQTFFFAAGGELVATVPRIIDERTLALQIDEIISRSR